MDRVARRRSADSSYSDVCCRPNGCDARWKVDSVPFPRHFGSEEPHSVRSAHMCHSTSYHGTRGCRTGWPIPMDSGWSLARVCRFGDAFEYLGVSPRRHAAASAHAVSSRSHDQRLRLVARRQAPRHRSGDDYERHRVDQGIETVRSSCHWRLGNPLVRIKYWNRSAREGWEKSTAPAIRGDYSKKVLGYDSLKTTGSVSSRSGRSG